MFATEGLGFSKENIKNSRKNAIILKTLSSFRKVHFFFLKEEMFKISKKHQSLISYRGNRLKCENVTLDRYKSTTEKKMQYDRDTS